MPAPAGNGMFIVLPSPAPRPVSDAAPVPGYNGHWWMEKKKTSGSS